MHVWLMSMSFYAPYVFISSQEIESPCMLGWAIFESFRRKLMKKRSLQEIRKQNQTNFAKLQSKAGPVQPYRAYTA